MVGEQSRQPTRFLYLKRDSRSPAVHRNSEEIQESAERQYSGLFQEIRTLPPHWGYFAPISIPNVSFGRLTIPLEIRVHVPWLACAQNPWRRHVRKSKQFLAMGVAFAMSVATVTGLLAPAAE